MSQEKYSIRRQLGSLTHALDGLVHFFRYEPKAYVHLIFDLIIVLSGIAIGYTESEWIILIVGMVVLLATELLNSAIEELCDLLHPEHHTKIKATKDMSSAAVMMVAVLVGLLWIFYSVRHLWFD